MTLIRIIGEDGQPMHMDWGGKLPKGAEVIERLPEPFEVRADGKWTVLDHEALANWRAGPEHIAEARAQKRIEALLLKSGVALAGGLLVAEAGRRGITPVAMADIVNAKAAAFMADELARQDASIAPIAEVVSGP